MELKVKTYMKNVLMILSVLLIFSVSADAKKVSGTVKAGEEKLEGVIVTDVKNFTQTKRNGKFSFEIEDDADFVYIVTPSGYIADWSTGVPQFYMDAAGRNKFEFNLIPMAPADDYFIVAVSDPQFKNEEQFGKFAGQPMDDLCNTTKSLNGFAVGLVLGDICWDNLGLLPKYKTEILRTGIPFYPVSGNHDHDRAADGDINSIKSYRRIMGPENYAFFIGNDVVIVLDNIIYEGNKKYREGYANHVISWVKALENLLPENADIYVAQHSPVKTHWNNKKIVGTSDILSSLRGHKVTFISGHTHINNIFEYEENITEHNVASICAAWWDTIHCTDGTPRGYKVFEKKGGKLSWYYKSVGQPADYQAQLFGLGQSRLHPNSVLVNVWDWDPSWSVEWFEDGKPMGKLKPVKEYSPLYIREVKAAKPVPNHHYFAATPSQYAKNVTIAVQNPFGRQWVYNYDMTEYVDVQAHRGGAGLKPENTIEAMKNALDLGVNTLEFDLQVTADGQVVVSHDPYFIDENGDKKYIYQLPYSETGKPLAGDMIDFVENYTKEMGYSPVRYNIEIKSVKGPGEGKLWPTYDHFSTICCKLLNSKYLDDRLVVQSFDPWALNYIHEKYPELILSYLIDDDDAPEFEKYMAKLRFTPQWLSPHQSLVNEELIRKCREKGMRVVPWTVNDPEDIKKMMNLGVEAIISNYPDRIIMQTRGY